MSLEQRKYSTGITIWQWLLLIVFMFVAYFYGLSLYPIADMNEGLYAEVAREMLELKDYLIPHLNYVPYLEKPPLFYWLVALSYKVFGVSTFAARLIPALSCTAVTTAIIWLMQGLQRAQYAWTAALILASSFVYILIGRVVFFDMLLTATLTFALSFFYLWYVKDKTIYLHALYLCLALSFLCKGMLPLILVFLIAMVFLFLRKTPKAKFLKLFHPFALLLFFLIIGVWAFLAMQKLPAFGYDFFINEQVLRFWGTRMPDDYHHGPVYFYIPRVIAYLFPWTLFLPLCFKRWREKISGQDPLTLFLWLWFLVPLVLLSLSGAKGDYYMVLGIPPLVLLLAQALDNYMQQNKFRLLFLLFCVTALIVLSASIYILNKSVLPLPVIPAFRILLLILSLYFMLSILCIYRFKNSRLTFLLFAGFMLPVIIFYVHFERIMQTEYKQIALTDYIKTHDAKRDVYLFKDYETVSTVLFNLQRRLPIIDSVSMDLYFGSHTKDAAGWFISGQEFLQRSNGKSVYVVMRKNEKDNFAALTGAQKYCVVAASYKALIMTNDAVECQGAKS
jgi:4-amino-4-deoxy-L-arabinose transferase-like glycosyltransferase